MNDNRKSFKKVEEFEQYFIANVYHLFAGIDEK